jgi:hypothetical protein
MKNVLRFIPPFLLALFWLPAASAHEIRPVVATVTVSGAGVALDMTVNLEALLVGVSPAHRDTDDSPQAQEYNALRALPPEALATRWQAFAPQFLAGVGIEIDGVRHTARLTSHEIPPVGDVKTARISRVRLEADVPAGSRVLRFTYNENFGTAVLRFPQPNKEIAAVWLKDGKPSEAYVIGVGLREPGRGEVAAQYTALGFTHILPYGLDHILFVLGLFLLSVKLKPLLIQVTAFTVAHTLTLALTVHGVVSLPSTIVEPLIAASIVYVAVENIATSRLHAWRPFVVFGFGLLHGMGFAGVLEEIGLPREQALTGLITFNVGVELGQLAVISIAYALVGHWFKDQSWYRARIVVPASALIALVGAYWTVERVFLS